LIQPNGTSNDTGTVNEKGSASYQHGYDAARKKLEDSHILPPSLTSATSLNGTIKSIGADSITIDVLTTSANPLDELKVPVSRKVTIAADTKFTRMTQKSPEQLQKDFDQYQKDIAATKSGATPPSPVTIETLTLVDLKVGDTVNVTADHDILKETSFTATQIDLAQMNALAPTTPTPPPTPAHP
jgi:hypothetical protein